MDAVRGFRGFLLLDHLIAHQIIADTLPITSRTLAQIPSLEGKDRLVSFVMCVCSLQCLHMFVSREERWAEISSADSKRGTNPTSPKVVPLMQATYEQCWQ